ncbi:hypothetical protein COMA1_90004 [Candidatus Nitrospira nitrosa]|uniref:Uncharacterized protein n=1 Tax=Candidatus Nitrospira nitrosa TaxID=1742972 RepID=A0A0S4LSK0_9BACT|nr:hypothetical protein COMA1_90004 [Candidatus Nitrospira nitrosa]
MRPVRWWTEPSRSSSAWIISTGYRFYNEQWLVERHRFGSPRQVRCDLLVTSEGA